MKRVHRIVAGGRGALALAAAACLFIACGDGDDLQWLRRPLAAFCTIDVEGKGTRQVESDYVPRVVACENGAADMEALKAQAVAARTYMYYSSAKSGKICDGTKCQVYTCSAQPKQKHHDAVKATAGQVLMYSGVVICSFYVAGAKPTTPSCQALPGDPDPTQTEKWVTYNEGKTGTSITQTPLGFRSPSFKYNRGCKSQNGAHCQSLKGKTYDQILRFYYGADIKIVTATGSCVAKPDAASPAPDLGTTDGSPPSFLDGLPAQEPGAPAGDAGGDLPPTYTGPDDPAASGGCRAAPLPSSTLPGASVLILLILYSLFGRRR